MSEFGFGFRSLLRKDPKTPRVLILDPEHQETPQWLTQRGWTPKESERKPKQEWTPTPKKMATQTVTQSRLTDIPEHTLDEALQQKGEPSTPAKGKDLKTNPLVENQPDNNNNEPDPGDNYSIGGDEPPYNPPGGGCKSTVFYRTPAPIIVYYFPYITCLLYLLFLIKHVRTSG